MTFAPHDVLPRVLRPSTLRRRAGMVLHRSATLAGLADDAVLSALQQAALRAVQALLAGTLALEALLPQPAAAAQVQRHRLRTRKRAPRRAPRSFL
jgi:hypothetical protein